MYTQTGLFYAYAKNINDDWSYRYLITFATRDVADSWWRAVTDSVSGGYQRFSAVKRVSLQFFTHNPGQGNIPDTLTDPKVASQFLGKVFFTLINDRDGRILSVIPVLNYTDNISGDKYFIRSSLRPDYFWYFDGSLVRASNTRRTKFTISISDEARKPGTVIIGSDEIVISVDDNTNIGITNPLGALGASIDSTIFKFSDFSDNFAVTYNYDNGMGVIARNPSEGESWELL